MNIAVTYENGRIFQHFGQTKQFKVYEVKEDRILSSSIINPKGSGHGALVQFLQNAGIKMLVCGGIGDGARIQLVECGISLFAGVSGSADEQIMALLKGELHVNSDAGCSGHASGSCSSHSCGNDCH